jgi:beta-lactamase class A
VRRRIVLAVIILGFFIAGAYLSIQAHDSYQRTKQRQILLEERRQSWKNLDKTIKSEIKNFNGEVAAVIKDFNTGTEIVINENKLLPSASLVKIPIMAACFNAVVEGSLKLDETIRLQNAYKVSGSGILKQESPGKEYTIEKLIELMIAESDNTAANMLIERIGKDYLNDFFKRIGLKNTNLAREMMDFEGRKEGVENYTTSRDMALLLEKMYYGRLLNASLSKKCLQILTNQKVNDRIPKKLPAETIVAHKTGLEKGICHDAGIVYTTKGNFLICVLTKHKYKSARQAKRLISDISLVTYKTEIGG